jgi:hypothetical protein
VPKVVELFIGTVIGLKSEVDGVSIFSNEQKGYVNVSMVQPSIKNIYQVGGQSYGNLLMCAFQAYREAQSDPSKITQSDFLLRQLGANLKDGILQLLAAATESYNFDAAVEILHAVCYSKLFLPSAQ